MWILAGLRRFFLDVGCIACFSQQPQPAPSTQLRIEMLYAIMATDVANSLESRLAARPAHLARLEQLKTEGRLILAGPHPAIDSNDPGPAGFSGSLIVAEFESLRAAEQWANADPYRAAGVYANVVVKPFKRVLP
jgi:uncharacterized protein YciI